jgi:P pilus assembly chaperone PapD
MLPMRIASRRTRGLEVAGLVLGTAVPLPAVAQLEVSALEVVLADAGGPVNGTFSVRNTSTVSRTVHLKLQDWERDESGANRFGEPGTVPASCHPRLQVFPVTMQLEAGESQPVRVTYSGERLGTTCWLAVSVTTAPDVAADDSPVRVVLQIEHVVKVYVEPEAALRGAEIVDVDIVPSANGSAAADSARRQVMVVVRGAGTAQTRVRGRIEYRTTADSVAAAVKLEEFPVLPGAQRRVTAALPALRPGLYIVLVLLDYGGAEIVAAQLELEVST